MEGSDRDSIIRRDPSYGALSQNKDKEETTTKEILKALQVGRNRGESSGIQKLGAQMRKENSSRNLVKRFGVGENNNHNHNNHNNNEDATIIKIDKIGAPLMGEKSKTLPKKQEQALDKFLFDAVYTNKYLEVRCIDEKVFKLLVDKRVIDIVPEDCTACER